MAKVPPAFVVNSSERFRFALSGLRRKMVPASLATMDFISDLWGFQVVYTLTELKVWDHLARGLHSSLDIAAEISVDKDCLYRLLRAATNIDLVKQISEKEFELLPIGRALCESETETFRDFIVFMGRHGWRFWGKLLECTKNGQSAIELETGMQPFEYLNSKPELAEDFNRAMTAISNIVIDAFIAGYNFSDIGTVVDVGGGHGRLLGGVLEEFPQMKGILFDLPGVVEGAERVLNKLGIKDRCEVVGGDFFSKVPDAGDLYIMKAIIHDWNDEDAIKILSTVRESIPKNGKLALIEMIVPGPNKKHLAKFLDIEMIVHAAGKERTKEEFAQVLQRANFKLKKITPLAGPTSVIEARPA